MMESVDFITIFKCAQRFSNEIGSLIWKKKGVSTAPPIDPRDSLKILADAVKETRIHPDAIGIASFGPLDAKNGKIAITPKPTGNKFPVVSEVRKLFPNIPIVLDTDVNAPAFNQYLAFQKVSKEIKNVGYVTIGTRVGLGIFSDNKTYHFLGSIQMIHLVEFIHFMVGALKV
jgi:fructokinase